MGREQAGAPPAHAGAGEAAGRPAAAHPGLGGGSGDAPLLAHTIHVCLTKASYGCLQHVQAQVEAEVAPYMGAAKVYTDHRVGQHCKCSAASCVH